MAGLPALIHRWKEWRQYRQLRSIAKLLLIHGFDVKRPETLREIVDTVRQHAVDNRRSVREAEDNVVLLTKLAEMLEREQGGGET